MNRKTKRCILIMLTLLISLVVGTATLACEHCGVESWREVPETYTGGQTQTQHMSYIHVCNNCGQAGESLWRNHKYQAGSTVCSVCQYESAPVHEHTWGTERTYTVYPTCTTGGSYYLTCTTCGEMQSYSVSALGHNYGDWEDYSNTQHQKICSRDISHIEFENHVDSNGDGLCDICAHGIVTALPKPFIIDTYVYSGFEYEAAIANYDGLLMTASNIYRTNAGTQYVSIILNDKINYCWDDGSVDDLSLEFTVERATIDIPEGLSFVFNDTIQQGVPNGQFYEISGTYSAKDVGEYTATVQPDTNHKWSDGTITSKNISWSITPAIVPDVITVDWEYDGKEKEGVTPVQGLSITGDLVGTDAKTYTAIATPDSNHTWSDGTRTAKTLTWEITKKPISVIWGSQTVFNYDGSAHAPTATIQTGVLGETMAVTRTTKTNVGTYTSVATPGNVTGGRAKKGNYLVTNLECDFSIVENTVSDFEITLSQNSFEYDGTQKRPSVTVRKGGTTLTASNYTVSYQNNINAGTATVLITGQGTYTGSGYKTFTINKKQISTVWDETTLSFTYDGNIHLPVAAANTGITGEMVELLVLGSNKDAGSYTATALINKVSGGRQSASNYELTNTTHAYVINQREIVASPKGGLGKVYGEEDSRLIPQFSNLVEGEIPSTTGSLTRAAGNDVGEYAYTGIGSIELIDNGTFNANNYTLSYANNGNQFKIEPKDLSYALVAVDPVEEKYNGSEIRPSVTVSIEGITLTRETDYSVTYKNNINVGVATVEINGSGNYKGKAEGRFSIKPSPIIDYDNVITTVLNTTSMVYTGTPREPEATVTLNGIRLEKNLDYTISYRNNINVGNNAVAIIKGIGRIFGTKELLFSITPTTLNGTATVEPSSFIYSGKENTPLLKNFTLDNGTVLVQGRDYEVSYRNNIDVGRGVLIATGKNGLGGTQEFQFEIKKRTPIITMTDRSVPYTGQPFALDGASVYGTINYKNLQNVDEISNYIVYNYYSDSGLTTKINGVPTEIGTYYVQATLPEDANHNEAKSNVAKLTIFGAPSNPIISGNNGNRTLPSGCTVNEGLYINIYGSEITASRGTTIKYMYRINEIAWIAYSGTISNTLEGHYIVEAYAYVAERPSLRSETVTYEFTIDKSVPEISDSDIVIPETTDTVVIEVDVTNTDIKEIFITETQGYNPTALDNWSNVRGRVNGKTIFELSQGDEVKTLYIWERDEAGNVSGPITKNIILNATKIGNINNNKANIFFKVTDEYLHTANITKDDVLFYINGFETSGKLLSLSREEIANGYKFSGVMNNITGDGELSFKVSKELIFDKAGNTISNINEIVRTEEITVDNTIPKLNISSSEASIHIEVSDEHLKAVMINGAIVANQDGSYDTELFYGKNTITAIDEYGNENIKIVYRESEEAEFIRSTPNEPELYDGMKAVYYTGDTENVSDYFDETMYSYEDPNDNLENTSSEWANAKTEDGSMWVWIPRYAYKVTYYTDATKTSVSDTKTNYASYDILFLHEASNDYKDQNGTISPMPDGYTVAAAFAGSYDNGNSVAETRGFWISKYEISMETSSDGQTWVNGDSAEFGGGNILTTNAGNSEYIRAVSKPNRNSWRGINISNAYLNSSSMLTKCNSHLAKNSEFEAALILGNSAYGRNGSYIALDTDIKTGTAVATSTTGNVTGVFDMLGGAWEYTSTYLNTLSDTSDTTALINGKSNNKEVLSSSDLSNIIFDEKEYGVMGNNPQNAYQTSKVVFRGLDYTNTNIATGSIPSNGAASNKIGYRVTLSRKDRGTLTTFTVKNYTRNLNSASYTLNSTDTFSAYDGDELFVSSYRKEIPGFTLFKGFINNGGTTIPENGEVQKFSVDKNGNTVLNIYYRRNILRIKFHVNGGYLGQTSLAGAHLSDSFFCYNGAPKGEFWQGVYGGYVGSRKDATLDTVKDGIYNYNNSSAINFKRTGYYIESRAEWNTKPDGTGTSFDQAKTNYSANTFAGCDLSKGDQVVTLYANWKPIHYTIRFDQNNGTGSMEDIPMVYEQTVTLPNNTFTREDCVFLYWNTKPDRTGTTYQNGATVRNLTTTNNAVITLYAQWRFNYARYESGPKFNEDIKKLAGTANATVSSDDYLIRKIEWQNGPFTVNNVPSGAINVAGIEYMPIYAWLEGTTVKLWSESEKVLLDDDCSSMFRRLRNLSEMDIKDVLHYTNSDNVTNLAYLFSGCNNITDIDMTDFNTSIVTDMSYIFNECTALAQLDISTFNTEKVENFTAAFKAIRGISILDLTVLDTSSATDMTQMFYGNDGIVELIITSFDTSKVEKMSRMFYGCSNLTKILASENFVTTSVTDDSNMFTGSQRINGGSGTTYNAAHVGKEYAHLDGKDGLPGYFWNEIFYTIAFNANGGTGTMSNIPAQYGFNVTLPSNTFTRNGYTFNGWNTKADGTGTAYANEATVKNLTYVNNSTVTLYAQWNVIVYTITYDLDGGNVEVENPTTYTVETPTFTLNNPIKEGYTFKGWTGTELPTARVSVSINQGSYGDRSYVATWEEKVAKYVTGKNFNAIIKQLAGDTGATHQTVNTTITGIEWQTSKPADSILNASTTKNVGLTTETPIYAWFDNGKIKLWSDARHIYFNEDMSLMFVRISNLNELNPIQDCGVTEGTSNVTNLYGTFAYTGINGNTYKLKGLSTWDVSKVTSMTSLFLEAGKSAQTWEIGDLSSWNTSKVTRMDYMFYRAGMNASNWNIGSLANWDVSKVTTALYMFREAAIKATSFNLGNLDNWNTGNITTMGSMFASAGKEAQTWNIGDLSGWNTSNSTNMQSMFRDVCVSGDTFNIGNINNWNTSKVTDMSHMFNKAGQSASNWNIGELDNWNTSQVKNMSYMFQNAGMSAATWNIGKLDNWNTEKVTSFIYMFQYAGYSANTFDIGNLDDWEIGSATSISYMFNYAGYNSETWNIGHLDNWDVSNIEYMTLTFGWAAHGVNDTWDIGNLDNWKTGKVKSFAGTFQQAGNGATTWNIGDLSNWNVSSCTNADGMFTEAAYHATSMNIGNLDNWNVSNLVHATAMFCDLGLYATSWNIGNLSNWDVSNVETMHGMFYHYGGRDTSADTLDLSGWDTSKVTDMNRMFSNSSVLKKIYASPSFVTTNVTDSENMFRYCPVLKGGNGTVFNENHIDAEYAWIDGRIDPDTGVARPGYFWCHDEYQITYDKNTTDTVTNMPEAQTKKYGEPLTLSSMVPVRIGYTFKGWAEASDGPVLYNAGGTYRKNSEATLCAQWEIRNYGEFDGDSLVNAYDTLQEAFSGATSGRTIKPLVGITETTTASVPLGKTLSLDLNGKVTSLSGAEIVNNGNLTITGEGTLSGDYNTVVTNTGTFVQEGTSTISFNPTTNTNETAECLAIINSGICNLNGGTITGTRAIRNIAQGAVIIQNMTIQTTRAGIQNRSSRNTEANPGLRIISGSLRVTNSGNVVSTSTGGLTVIDGGTIQGTSNDTPAVINSDGRTIINGGTITKSRDRAVRQWKSTTGVIEVRGGTINSTQGVGISSQNGGTIIVTGGTITGGSEGIRLYGTDTLIIGTNEQVPDVSTEVPSITGGTMGINAEVGTIKFYDGVIKGSTNNAIVGSVAEVPVNYGIKKTTSGNIETAILVPQYVITYNANGGQDAPASQNKLEGVDIALASDEPTRLGYAFNGWSTTSNGTVEYTSGATYSANESTTLYAVWSEETYVITYDLDGGTVAAANPTSYTVETETFTLINPTKDGYTFTGWTGTGLSTASDSVSINKGSTGDRSYTATWSIIRYTVEYYQGNNSSTSGFTKFDVTDVHTYGQSKNLKTYAELGGTAPEGWTFDGWSQSETGTRRTFTDGQSVTNLTDVQNGVIKLYAIFVRSIRFKSGSTGATGKIIKQYYNPYNVVGYLTSVEVPTLATISEYWNPLGYREDTVAGTATVAIGSNITPAVNGTTTYYGVYEKIIDVYSGVLKETHTTTTQYVNVNNNTVSSVEVPPLTTIDGWTKNGYRDDELPEWAHFSVGDTARTINISYDSSNTTLYGVYNHNCSLEYRPNYSGATMSVGASKIVCLNTSSATTGAATFTINNVSWTSGREGYNFVNWNTEPDGSGITYVVGDSVVKTYQYNAPSFTTTIYAQWTPIEYSIAFDANGGTGTAMASIPATYDVAQNLPTNTYSKTDYAFDSWNTMADGSGTSYNDGQSVSNLTTTDGATITLYAQWRQSAFTISYELNGGTVSTPNPFGYSVDSETFTLNNPTKSGYDFVGWSGTGLTGNANKTVTIPHGSTGNRSYTANWTYTATPQIVLDDYNTFNYSADGGALYFVSTTQTTVPSAGTSGWTTSTTTGNLTLVEGTTYYVWVKDENGEVSPNGSTIAVRTITREVAEGSTLIAKYTDSEGADISFSSNKANVLNGTAVYIQATANMGYHDPILKINDAAQMDATYVGNVTSNVSIRTMVSLYPYTITYDLDGGTVASANPTSGYYNTNVNIANHPTKSGYTFTGWTATSGLNTTNAKYGDTASTVTTSWSSASTKVKAKYFVNLATLGSTIVLKANWLENNYLNTSTSTYYETLATALSEVQSNQTIQVVKDLTDASTEDPTLASGKTGVKLDLVGKTVTLNKQIANNGELDIYTTVNGAILQGNFGGGNTIHYTGALLFNKGTLTINETNDNYTMSIINSGDGEATNVIYNEGTSASITLKSNVTLKNTWNTNNYFLGQYVVYNQKGNVVIDGAKIENESLHGIYNNTNAQLTILSGRVETKLVGICSYGNTYIYGTESETIISSSDDYAIYSEGPLNIWGGKIISTRSEISDYYNADGLRLKGTQPVNIYGGNISGGIYGIDVDFDYDSVCLNIYGGTIIGRGINGSEDQKDYGIYLNNGTVEVSGDVIVSGQKYGIYNNNGTVRIRSGTIEATATDGIGISAYNYANSVVLGSNDNDVSTTSPVIKAISNIGVSVRGTAPLYFYDGRIQGEPGKSIYSDVTVITPSGYVVNKTTADGIETATLAPTFTSTIRIKKDDVNWSSSGMNVALYQDGVQKYAYSSATTTGSNIVFNDVLEGTYDVYATRIGTTKTTIIDTGIDISTSLPNATLDYYTVTRVVGSNSSLTTKIGDSSGTSFTTTPTQVLKGETIYANATASGTGYTGYLKVNNIDSDNNTTYAINSATKFASSRGYIKYPVTYYPGTTDTVTGMPANQVKTYGTTLKLSSDRPSRTGYYFLGWATTEGATSATYQPGANYTTNAALSLYAIWRGPQITFNGNGSNISGISSLAPVNAPPGQAITIPTTDKTEINSPITMHSFAGWSTTKVVEGEDTEVVEYYPGDQITITEDTTLYAVYTSDLIESVANAPVLGDGMKAVWWTDENDPLNSEVTGNSYPAGTYSYVSVGHDVRDEKQSKWANAITEEDGSYWVWIPRYAYKIHSFKTTDKSRLYKDEIDLYSNHNNNKTGQIEIIFLNGTTDKYLGTDNQLHDLPEGYIVHPAFQKMTTEEESGGLNPLGKWDSEIEGIWIAKYEMSLETSIDGGTTWENTNTINYSNSQRLGCIYTTNAGNEDLTTIYRVVSKPNMNVWGEAAVDYQYDNSKYMNPNLNSHLIKNSEWGAVSYLSYSTYGRNGTKTTVDTNQIVTDNNDKETSTTGNIYGIFDMSGGGAERVAAYNLNTTAQSSLTRETNIKYRQRFQFSNTSIREGEAGYEVTYLINNHSYSSWEGEDYYMIDYSYVLRGGCSVGQISEQMGIANNPSDAGLFASISSTGYSKDVDSIEDVYAYRAALIIGGDEKTITYTSASNDSSITNIPAPQQKRDGFSIDLSEQIPTRTGYTFYGWADSATSTKPVYQPGDRYSKNGDATLYAIWMPDEHITYDATNIELGIGTFTNGTSQNIVAYDTNNTVVTKYSHTSNIDDEGIASGTYSNNLETNDVVTIPGAISLHVKLYYSTQSTLTDWVCVWEGNKANYIANRNYSSSKLGTNTGKFGDGMKTTFEQATLIEGDIDGDTVTFGFHSNASSAYYGYYAIVTNNGTLSTAGGYEEPILTNMNFVGWADVNNTTLPTYTSEQEVVDAKIPDGTVYAVYGYNIEYDLNGGTSSAIPNGTKLKNVDLTLPSTTREEFTFMGWDENPNQNPDTPTYVGTSAIYSANASVKLYAIWKANEYQITYNANAGTDTVTNMPENQIRYGGTTLTLSDKVPVRGDYTFLGWKKTASGTSAQFQPGGSYSDNNSVILYALWAHKVTYNANGGTGAPAAQNKIDGVNLTLSSTKPTKEGVIFVGWSLGASDNNVVYHPGDIYSTEADLNLFAVYGAIITFDANAEDASLGSVPTTVPKVSGVILTLPYEVPTRPGYAFLGWSDNSQATSPTYIAGANYTQEGANTLYAIWGTNYTVTYNSPNYAFSGGGNTNTVTYSTSPDESVPVETFTKYSHTANINDEGTATGTYANNLNTNKVITIPGASTLHVKLYYSTESASFDWVCVWAGNHPEYTASSNYSTSKLGTNTGSSGKFGGGKATAFANATLIEGDIEGDSVTFGFKSDSSSAYYGYYAIVTGDGYPADAYRVSGTYKEPILSPGYSLLGWSMDPNATVPDYTNEYEMVLRSPANRTVYAVLKFTPSAPTIVTHPESKIVPIGSSIGLSVVATDGIPTPNTYQWQVSTDGGSTWNDLSGEILATYNPNMTADMDGYKYRVLLGNSYITGSDRVVSNVATVQYARYQNTDTGLYYVTLTSAMSAVESNQTIKPILMNITEKSNATLASGKTGVRFDIAGSTITSSNSIANDGELEILTSVQGGTLDLPISNGTGTMLISSGTINKAVSTNTGTLTITGGTINANVATSGGTINMSGGEINSSGHGISTHDLSHSTIYLSGSARINATQDGIHIVDDSALEMDGNAYVSGGRHGIFSKGSRLTIRSGTVESTSTDYYAINYDTSVTGQLILGVNDSVVDTTNPIVRGINCPGIKRRLLGSGVKFYDGIIQGKTKAFVGDTSFNWTIASGYKKSTTTVDGIQTTILVPNS